MPAGGDLVGSPGFTLGTQGPPEAVREAINVAIFRWGVFPGVKINLYGKIFSFSYLGLGAVLGDALGDILGVSDGVAAGNLVG
eukprot:12846231-Ditylum_brightwellii.AAC.2